MNLQELTAKLAEKASAASPLGKSVKFDFGDDGKIFVDGYNGNAISNEDKDADCTIGVTIEDFMGLITGDLNPMNAFFAGKLRIDGEMGVAMQLQSLLG